MKLGQCSRLQWLKSRCLPAGAFFGVAIVVGFWPALFTASFSVAGEIDPSSGDTAREHERFFEMHIRPLLIERCLKCHGEDAQKGGLRLDSREAVLAGGESGPAVTPGKPGESLLIEAINHATLEMPPDGKLPAPQIELLSRWVALGVPWGVDKLATPHDGLRESGVAFTAEDRAWRLLQPLQAASPPAIPGDTWSQGEIDRFLLVRLREHGLAPAPPAPPDVLVRRIYFDVTGLPPTAEQVEEFKTAAAMNRERAVTELVDRLLASPRYGERWARRWLDLVRYAESDGFKADDFRPDAWRYRDYVIAALNSDKPYDRFVQEQIAGDELAPHDSQAVIATGFLRLGIYEYNQRDVRGQWNDILNEITDVVSDSLLGLGMGCARCHDHKFDPILQKDYYRLRAFFEAILPRDGQVVATPQQQTEYHVARSSWEAATEDIRRELEAIERPYLERAFEASVTKFPRDILAMIRKSPAERTPQETQLAELALRQPKYDQDRYDFAAKLKGEEKAKWEALRRKLAEFDGIRPAALDTACVAGDVGPIAPPTTIPGNESANIEPGWLTLFGQQPFPVEPLSQSTGRRTALAKWITAPDNALTLRVAVNRLWQHHFGRGLVATASDFGRLGESPSHPELLDWLADRFVRDGFSLKAMHRRLLTSAAYAQSSQAAPMAGVAALAAHVDPENRLLWRASSRRLEAEEIRDSLLQASGELDLSMGGPSFQGAGARRAIYMRVMRNQRDPLMDAFDAPFAFASTSERTATCTPSQSLLMINGQIILERAKATAARIAAAAESDADRAGEAYRLVLSRAASQAEIEAAIGFLSRQAAAAEVAGAAETAGDSGEQSAKSSATDPRMAALFDLCHVLLNSNEFLFVD